MEFDRFSVVLLVLRPDAPQLDEAAANALQDAHLSHLADLHDAGDLVAAGPLEDEKFRGLTILRVDADEARELMERDPSVRTGRFSLEILPWHVPAGAISYSPTRFPRSLADVDE
jgi:uncharacterized protein YciI